MSDTNDETLPAKRILGQAPRQAALMSASRRQLRLVDVDIDLFWSDPGLRIVGENLPLANLEGYVSTC